MSEFTLPPPPVPGFGPAEPILEQFNMTPFAKMAQAGARQAAGTIASDLQPALDVANDPRNAWIGTNPVGRGAVGTAPACQYRQIPPRLNHLPRLFAVNCSIWVVM